jgi:hypothetical protein
VSVAVEEEVEWQWVTPDLRSRRRISACWLNRGTDRLSQSTSFAWEVAAQNQ